MCLIVKYALIIVNVIFTLAGLTILGLGIPALVNTRHLSDVASLNAIITSIFVLGAAVFLVAFFGCSGSIKENLSILITYAFCLLPLVGGKIYLTVLMFNFSDTLFDESITKAFNNNELRNTFHAMERTFGCCGTYGPDSYNGILPALPPSCCPYNESQQCERQRAFGGCINIIAGSMSQSGKVLGSFLASIVAVELVAMLLAILLAWIIRGKRRQTV